MEKYRKKEINKMGKAGEALKEERKEIYEKGKSIERKKKWRKRKRYRKRKIN